MAQIAARECNICEENEGKYVCYECSHFFCECCKLLHAKFPANRHHTVTDSVTIDLQTFSFKHKCKKHNHEFLHFCSTCSCLTCNECVTSEHNSHVFRSVEDVATDAREIIKENIINVKSKISILTHLAEEIKLTTMAQIQKDYEQFTCDVTNLSETLKNVLHEVTDKKMNHASDYLVLENVHWNHNLAKVETLLQEHTFMCTKLENILNESHNVTFYLNHSELIQEFTAADEIPVFEEPTRMIGLNVGEFIENVLEMIKSKYSISYMTEELTRYEVETKTLNEQISNDNERYQKEIDQLKDILTKEQASRDELAKALSNERDLYEKGKKQYQKETNNLHDALTGKQAEIDLMNASWTIERRLFEREKEQFNRQIRKDKEKYQKDTENLNATLTRKQAEMDEMNAFYRMEKELYETENKKVFEQMKSDQERFQEETENLHDTLDRKQTEFDQWNTKHGETRINEMEQTIDRLEAELRNCLNSTEPDLDSQLLEEDEDTKEISTQAEKLYRCRYCKEEKVLPKGM